MVDLYGSSLGEVPFTRLCGGNQQNEDGESCVLIAPISGLADAFALRDSKYPDARTLRFTGDELPRRRSRHPLSVIPKDGDPCPTTADGGRHPP